MLGALELVCLHKKGYADRAKTGASGPVELVCLHKKGSADRTPARAPGRGPGSVLRLAPRSGRCFLAPEGLARRRGWKRVEKLVLLGPWSWSVYIKRDTPTGRKLVHLDPWSWSVYIKRVTPTGRRRETLGVAQVSLGGWRGGSVKVS